MLKNILRNRVFSVFWMWAGLLWLLLLLTTAPVFAAGPVITVDSNGDTATPGDGACTLREAVSNANTAGDTSGGDCPAGNGNDTIVFAPALNGQTITLSGAELSISSNVTIAGPGASRLAVSGNNASRVFSITAGAVTISGLTVRDGQISGADGAGIANAGALTLDGVIVTANTISGGATTQGGGIYNTGALTVTHSAISGNANLGSSGSGGGIANKSGGSATIINSTISGNTANTYGGGIVNDAGAMTLVNDTIVNNAALNFDGGGLAVWGTTLLKNTIVANNTDKGGPNDCSYLFTSPTSQGYNLIETVGNCTFAATGDLTGQDPKLGAPGANDGETPTHFPLAGSPVIDAIPAGSNGCNDTVADDQRGYLRATGKACDTGAVEYNGIYLTLTKSVSDPAPQPAQTITYTLVVSLRQSGNVNLSSVLISDTMPAGINFVGPVAVTGGSGAITGPPPALVSGLSIAGGTVVTVTFPVTVSTGLASGATIVNTAAVTSAEVTAPVTATATLTVSNIGPAAGADTFSVPEDSGATGLDVRANDVDLNGDAITITGVGQPANGQSSIVNGQLSIIYTPTLDFNGVEVFTYTISDGAVSDTTTVTVTVRAVNDVPAFTGGADQWRIQTAGPQTVSAWATGISAGPADEAGQSLTFHLNIGNPALFSDPPALNSGSGDLTFTPAATMSGAAIVTVTLQDDGGGADGGVDTTAAQTFTLVIAPGDAVATIDPSAGGSLVYTDTTSGLGAWAQAPAGAVAAPTDLVFDELPPTTTPPPGSFGFAGRVFSINAWQNMALQTGFVFGTPITLTLGYNPADLGFIDESTLTLFAWDGSAWADDGLTVIRRDPAAHQVTVVISHLSEFALFGQAPAMRISKQVAGRSEAGSGSFGSFGSLNLPLGGVVTYTVVLSNSGGFVARGVVMSDVLPAGVSFAGWTQQGSALLPGDGSTLEWGPHDIQPGAAYTIEFTVDVTHAAAFAEQTIVNIARFSSDNAGSGADSAALLVAANTAPSISAVGNQSIFVNRPLTVSITIADLETLPDMLLLSGASSAGGLVSSSDIQFGGSGANRTVTITPATGVTGAAAITLTVTDGGGLTDVAGFRLVVSMIRVYLPLVLR